MIFIAALSCSSAQNLTLDCAFFEQSNRYGCLLNNIIIEEVPENVTFTGQHLANRTNADVETVRISNSNTPFLIQQIFETFGNITSLQVYDSQLQSLVIPANIQLQEVYINGNNISRIENGTFANQTRLTYMNLRDNRIQELDEDAFIGLSRLQSLVLIGNNVQIIAPRTFHPLTEVSYLDLERNNLSSIGDEVFSQNTQIRNLYLEYNQIEEISPRFIANFGENLSYINLSGNVCANRSFSFTSGDEFARIALHNALRNCFVNFNGTISELRHITLEFEGPLRLFDEFGNLVASVPE